MSLSITNNVASLNAQNNLTRTSSMLSKSLERLSSGLKINRGADGPAALVISEQQRAQIAGLTAAIDNTSKAVSLVQTAEGALNEINSLLTRIRSLAIDSANTAVNDNSALTANQSEIQNSLDTITRIANNTQFGQQKLLNGTLGVTVTRTDVVNAAVTSQVTTGLSTSNLAAGNYHLKVTTAFVPAVTGVAATSTAGATVTVGNAATFFNTAAPGSFATSTSGISVTGGANATFFNAAAAGAGADIAASAVTNAAFFTDAGNVTVGGITYAYTSANQVSDVIAAVNADAGNAFTISLSDSSHQFTLTSKTHSAAANGMQVTIAGATNQGTLAATSGGVDDGTAVNANAVTSSSFFTEGGNVVVGGRIYAYTANTQVSTVLAAVNADSNNRFTISLDNSTHQFTVTAKNTGTVDNGMVVSVLGATKSATVTATSGGVNAVARVDAAGEIVDANGASLSPSIKLTAIPLSDGTVLQNVALGIQFDVDNTAAGSVGDKGTVFSITTTGNGAIFQIGPNAGNTATLSVGSATADSLGVGIAGNQFVNLSVINVAANNGPTDALAVIDKAINQITVLRSNLGAFQQNTLESMANNLRTTLENTTAAEAVIRDTDFAHETAEFSKQQVLMQVGTSVLSNANATSQLVLSLFQKL
ncbi:MAG: hypothetical protein HY040_06530 [Planctomycetes bacterium]|nr:hypothetical protein [Planctomycetota bacterium]